jgi:hypothetical protein
MTRSVGLVLLILSFLLVSSVAQTTAPEIVLTAEHGPGPLDVTLQWTGGQPSFEVFRSADAASVCRADNLLGVTDVQIWVDTAPQGSVFYKVRSPSAVEPPELCNGVDDDCDGTIDNGAIDCNASACEDCIGGACRSRCGACADCVNGTCQTRCGPCETCVNGTCAACNPGQCQTCVNGLCQSTCDENQCFTCGAGGSCASFCASCETCISGICWDACDRSQCLSCQSGSCRSFCDPVCQSCTPQGCTDTCGPCQRCVNGACQSRCHPDACEECIDGICLSRCSPSETCVGGTCEPGIAGSGPS